MKSSTMRLTTRKGTASLVPSTGISTKGIHLYRSVTMQKPIRNSTLRSFSTGRASAKSTTRLPIVGASTKTPASSHFNILSTTHLSLFSFSLSSDPVRPHKLLAGLSTRSPASALASLMMTTTKSPYVMGSRLTIMRRLRGIWRIIFGL